MQPLQGSRNPEVPQKITIRPLIIQHREELRLYVACDQLLTQLHVLLTWKAGTFIGTLFSLFVEHKQEIPLTLLLCLCIL